MMCGECAKKKYKAKGRPFIEADMQFVQFVKKAFGKPPEHMWVRATKTWL